MKTLAIVGFVFVWCFSGTAQAQSGSGLGGSSVDAIWGHPTPSYRILPRPATLVNHGQAHTSTAPTNPIESKPASPYAYGWFGSKPTPHWHRQFGIQNAYTQWTLR